MEADEISHFRGAIPMSTTERDKCGLSSLLPMSCRNRAETFARHLHSRLRSLGNQDCSSSADESSWLGAHEAPLAVSHQPRHASDPDLYFKFSLLETPGSPEEELTESELMTLINNKDNLKLRPHKNGVSKFSFAGPILLNTHDSDSSDGPYYDTESEVVPPKNTNGYLNGCSTSEEIHNHESPPPEDSLYESPATTEITGALSSFSDDEATLSLRDEDYSSLEINGTCQDSISNDVEQQPKPEDCENVSEPERKSFLEVKSDEDTDKDEKIPRVRRCSSLKTGKTPPGTPGRKKIVRFADVLGLDLADVRTFLDEIPKIPTSAYDDLIDADLSLSTSDSSPTGSNNKLNLSASRKTEKILLPLFQQPGSQPNFLDKVREKNVCLENAVVSDPIDLCIHGIVRVRNLDYHKSVHIRYSLDAWKTFSELQASYVQNSCDGFSDTFKFLLYANTLTIGQKLEIAVRFHCKGCQYWDNNYGANYCFQCLPTSNNMGYISNGLGHYDDHWGGSFYY
ncbi:glycogen-binding subunit 76A-like isoform X4 [Photinus pyralis]|uniref:glycogen-binding subunit 76A-like isoform X4 n=1 Tax=Photinus pyralis TaxID=7054 RepID=UPI00126774DB|nr:glycogen-binding subunit 76A-like isoform X4 [Photinus pyralis]XP_031346709.1 glycogen-binding subunit 76A-like isoform X4 [Photinus pyralis]XP_031346711.1 glycogen-binding subunit 76A-like isoform X4 [Photinus pyralis]